MVLLACAVPPAEDTCADEEICGNGIDDDCDLEARGCGLVGELELDADEAITGTTAGDALGTLLVGGPIPAATAPGKGVLLLREERWIASTSPTFGAALDSSDDGLLIGDPGEGTVTHVDVAEYGGGESFGSSVAFVGGEVAVGTPASGIVSFLAAGLTLSGPVAFGNALAGGDMDGDGIDDVVVGGASVGADDPIAWLFGGPISDSRTVDTADASKLAWSDGVIVIALAGPCDVDGDGDSDVLLSTDATTMFLDGATLETREGWSEPRSDCVDANGDGWAEVASGGVFVRVLTGQSTDGWIDAPSPATVAFAEGDDAYADLIIGLPDSSIGEAGAGAVWILSGGPGF